MWHGTVVSIHIAAAAKGVTISVPAAHAVPGKSRRNIVTRAVPLNYPY